MVQSISFVSMQYMYDLRAYSSVRQMLWSSTIWDNHCSIQIVFYLSWRCLACRKWPQPLCRKLTRRRTSMYISMMVIIVINLSQPSASLDTVRHILEGVRKPIGLRTTCWRHPDRLLRELQSCRMVKRMKKRLISWLIFRGEISSLRSISQRSCRNCQNIDHIVSGCLCSTRVR